MTYAVKRYLGYEPWGVTNPWVYANLAQPQRMRQPESKYVWQTHPPREGIHPLGALGQTLAELIQPDARARRMEIYSLIGLGLTGFIVFRSVRRPVQRNRSRRRSRR